MSFLVHYGTPRHSGRYPWGSGDEPYQRTSSFLTRVDELKEKGLSDQEIWASFGMSKQQFVAKKSAEKNAERKREEDFAYRLKEKGVSTTEIGRRIGRNESYVRTLLKPSENQKKDTVNKARETLKAQVAAFDMIDVGSGAEYFLNGGISRDKMRAALAGLESEGYQVLKVHIPQPTDKNKNTTLMVLAKKGTTVKDIYDNLDKIHEIAQPESDTGDYFKSKVIKPPVSVSSKRLKVVYGEDGGAEADGLIELRPGVGDLSLGGKRYAQVRIAVDGTHYLKGVAVYNDDLPDGIDIRFNTNKHKNTPVINSDPDGASVLKRLKDDPLNPFESNIKGQRDYIDKYGKRKQSAINIVNEEGDWDKWQKSLSSQFVSKQPVAFAKKQLKESLDIRRETLDEIMAYSNPVVKKKLLVEFGDQMDSDAAHLRAAALPRQSWKTLIPIKSMKDNEVYSPDHKNGETVVLVRYPHGGRFEIPELKVNNRNKEAQKLLTKSPFDAIGINSKVAQKLSGADFDGDTVLVIPNNNGRIKAAPSLKGLKNFDPKEAFPGYKGMKVISDKTKQHKMGDITNLITDMQIKGATTDEVTRAVKHSMVVIDAHKHKLDWRASYEANGIAALKEKYQGSTRGGAGTLISKAKSPAYVDLRTPRALSKGGPIDKKTGKRVYETVPDSKLYYTDRKTGKLIKRKTKVTKMSLVDDAFDLSSGTSMEAVYATHANSLKALANQARKAAMEQPAFRYNPAARKTYAEQVARLDSALAVAKRNAPLERKAQIVAKTRIDSLVKANPSMDKDHKTKLAARELGQARAKVGAKKHFIDISDKEWEAIEAGAVSQTKLEAILNNAMPSRIKELAMPRSYTAMSPARVNRAKAMLRQGYTKSEIAEALGASVSTVNRALA